MVELIVELIVTYWIFFALLAYTGGGSRISPKLHAIEKYWTEVGRASYAATS